MIWYECNKWVHEGNKRHGSKIAISVRLYLKEFEKSQNKFVPYYGRHQCCWEPPPPSFIKINFDAAFSKEECKSCSGLVIKDYNGQVVVTHKNIPSPFVAEAIAYVQSLKWGKELGFQKVIIEGDSLSTIRKIQSENKDRSLICVYINDCKHMGKDFHTCIFRHIPRLTNEAVHHLVTEGLKGGFHGSTNEGNLDLS